MIEMLAMLIAAQEPDFPVAPLAKPFHWTAQEEEMIKVAVGAQLNDPYSAKYEFWPVFDQTVACGRVNAKNLYGAYVGPQLFGMTYARSRKTGKLIPDLLSVEMDPKVVNLMCGAALDGYHKAHP